MLEKTDIVVSLAGRDKGQRLIVLDIEEDYIYLVDGKSRNLQSPKRKKAKHVSYEFKSPEDFRRKFLSDSPVSNKDIRKVLSSID